MTKEQTELFNPRTFSVVAFQLRSDADEIDRSMRMNCAVSVRSIEALESFVRNSFEQMLLSMENEEEDVDGGEQESAVE